MVQVCQECGTENPDKAKFCIECGTSFKLNCPFCDSELPTNAKFCLECGEKIVLSPVEKKDEGKQTTSLEQYIPKPLLDKIHSASQTGGIQNERRVVSMLFCDLEGSTAAAEQLDPEEWVEIVNGTFEYLIQPVYKYEGVIARLMGDAILAFFGAPIAHEDDPERAVLAGLEILENVKLYLDQVKQKWNIEVNVRVGINTGLVVVGEMGSDMRVEYTAMGDAINIASRMESTAEPGALQISEFTYKLVEPLFEVENLGPMSVKGKSKPINTYRVLRKKPTRASLRGLKGLDSPLVGRDDEYDSIMGKIADLESGKGHIISIIAEAGLGKSRLVSDILKQLKSEEKLLTKIDAQVGDIFWLEGVSLSYQTSTPFAPFKTMLNQFFDITPDMDNEKKYNKIAKALTNHDISENEAVYLSTLLDLTPPDNVIHRIQYLDPPALRNLIKDKFHKLINNISTNKPIILVLDDIHWSDHSSLELLRNILPLVQSNRLLIILLFRPRRDEPSWELHEFITREYNYIYTPIELKALDQITSRFLVFNLLKIEGLSEHVRNLILEKSEGNPLYIEEVIRSLIDQNLIKKKGEHWIEVDEISNISIPNTLSGVLNTRLDNLQDHIKQTLQIASVIGREFDVNVLSRLMDEGDNLEKILIELESRELIVETARFPTRQYQFRHPMTQEAAYKSLLLKTRRDLHNQIAHVLETDHPKRVQEIAYHFLEAREFDNAFPYLVKSGDQASNSHSYQEAIQFYKKAESLINENTSTEDIHNLYDGLGQIYLFLGQAQEAIQSYENLLSIAKKREHAECEVNALNQLGLVNLMGTGQINQAVDFLESAETLATSCDYQLGLAKNYMIMCNVETATAEFDKVVDHLSTVAEIGSDLDDPQTEIYGKTHVSNTYYYMTRFQESIEFGEETLRMARENNNREFMAELLTNSLSMSYFMTGDIEKAERMALEGYTIASEIGMNRYAMFGAVTLSEINLSVGRYEEGRKYSMIASQFGLSDPIPGLQVLGKSCLYYMQLQLRYDREKLEEIRSEIEQLIEQPLGQFLASKYWIIDGYYHLNGGNLIEAENDFRKVIDEKTTLMWIYYPSAVLGLAEIAIINDDPELAWNHLSDARNYIESKNFAFYQPDLELTTARYYFNKNQLEKAKDHILTGMKHSKELAFFPKFVSLSQLAYKIGDLMDDQEFVDESQSWFDEGKTFILENISDDPIRERVISMVQIK